jgi:hypothetical protein
MSEDSVSGPFVNVACVCQTPLQEAAGNLSIIRIMDRVGIVGTTPQMQPQPAPSAGPGAFAFPSSMQIGACRL